MDKYKPARFRRLIAFLIDWALCYLVVLPVSGLAEILPTAVMMFVGPFCIFGFFGLFLGRDYLFCGRSIGKRALGLAVVDRKTGAIASGKQLLRKARAFFLYPVDMALLLFSGRSLGERSSGTAVVRYRESTPFVDKVRLRKVLTAACAIGAVFCLISCIAIAVLKQTEEYQAAYRYLTSSAAFARSGAEERDIELTGYSSQTATNADGASTSSTAYTFRIGKDWYKVIFHPTPDGALQLCEDCTKFE